MGRLLRKKTASKTKKKKQKESDRPDSNSEAVESEKKVISIVPPPKDVPRRPVESQNLKRAALSTSIPGGSYISKASQFLREVKIELKKVTWPSRKQTLGSTLVVIILVMIISLFLGVVDAGLSGIIRVVLQR
jgi:preprotein translocase subunit SecE